MKTLLNLLILITISTHTVAVVPKDFTTISSDSINTSCQGNNESDIVCTLTAVISSKSSFDTAISIRSYIVEREKDIDFLNSGIVILFEQTTIHSNHPSLTISTENNSFDLITSTGKTIITKHEVNGKYLIELVGNIYQTQRSFLTKRPHFYLNVYDDSALLVSAKIPSEFFIKQSELLSSNPTISPLIDNQFKAEDQVIQWLWINNDSVDEFSYISLIPFMEDTNKRTSNKSSVTLLDHAIKNDKILFSQALVTKGANVIGDKWSTPLSDALAKRSNLPSGTALAIKYDDLIGQLIAAGGDKNLPDRSRYKLQQWIKESTPSNENSKNHKEISSQIISILPTLDGSRYQLRDRHNVEILQGLEIISESLNNSSSTYNQPVISNRNNKTDKGVSSMQCTASFSTTSMTERTGFFALGTTTCPYNTESAEIGYSYTFQHTIGGGERITTSKNRVFVIDKYSNNTTHGSGTPSSFRIDNSRNIRSINPSLLSVQVKSCICNFKQSSR